MSTPEASRKYDTVVGSVLANELPNASTPQRLPTLSAHSVSRVSSRRTPSPVEPMLVLSKTLEPVHGRPREIAADTAARGFDVGTDDRASKSSARRDHPSDCTCRGKSRATSSMTQPKSTRLNSS